MSEVRDNIYATAIKILEDNSLDYRALVFGMASISPETLVAAIAKMQPKPTGSAPSARALASSAEKYKINSEICILARDGKKLAAIEALRKVSDLGLKDAKEAIDSLSPGICLPLDVIRYSNKEEEPIW